MPTAAHTRYNLLYEWCQAFCTSSRCDEYFAHTWHPTCVSSISLRLELVMDGPRAFALVLALRKKRNWKIRESGKKKCFLQRKKFGHSKLLEELRCTLQLCPWSHYLLNKCNFNKIGWELAPMWRHKVYIEIMRKFSFVATLPQLCHKFGLNRLETA